MKWLLHTARNYQNKIKHKIYVAVKEFRSSAKNVCWELSFTVFSPRCFYFRHPEEVVMLTLQKLNRS